MSKSKIDELLLAVDQSGGDVIWLKSAVRHVSSEPDNQVSLAKLFSAAGRKVGRFALSDQFAGWRTDEAARLALLLSSGEAAGSHIGDLYDYGDTDERCSVVKSLDFIDLADKVVGKRILLDAVRSQDPRLLKSALGDFGLTTLSDEDLNQVVLKAVFLEIPLGSIDCLSKRANPELSWMLANLARERVAASRRIDPSVWSLIDAFPPEDELAKIREDLDHPVEVRRKAAEVALTDLATFRKSVMERET